MATKILSLEKARKMLAVQGANGLLHWGKAMQKIYGDYYYVFQGGKLVPLADWVLEQEKEES